MPAWVVPYLTFNGNCAEAVQFYQEVLGGESQILRFGDAPPNPAFPVPEEVKHLVLHAELRREGQVIRFSDTYQGAQFTSGNNISFSLEFPTPEETQAIFSALATGGKVLMELQNTFFSPLYGKFIDRFGINWQVSCLPSK